MSDTEAIAKRIVANAHRLEWAIQCADITLADVVEVAKAYLQQSGRDVPITFDWLATFCRIDSDVCRYKHASFWQRSDGTWGCWIGTSGLGAIHLGKQFKTRGDVYDLLNGMEIPLKGA